VVYFSTDSTQQKQTTTDNLQYNLIDTRKQISANCALCSSVSDKTCFSTIKRIITHLSESDQINLTNKYNEDITGTLHYTALHSTTLQYTTLYYTRYK